MAEDTGDKLIWFLAGAAIGSVIALLYAPQSGERTRRMIGRKTREHADSLAESGRDLLDRGRDLYEKGRRVADDAADMIERGRRMVER